MRKSKRLVISAVFFTAMCLIASASQVHFTRLDEFLNSGYGGNVSVVAVAEVVSRDVSYEGGEKEKCGKDTVSNSRRVISYTIRMKEVLKAMESGKLIQDDYYAEYSMFSSCFCENNSVLCESPVLEGSGVESELDVGKQYVFWLDPLVGFSTLLRGAFRIDRADEIQEKGKIRKFLKQ